MIQMNTSFLIHDIPNYPTLFIRDGAFVFVVDKHTGEISKKLMLSEYVDTWTREYKNNTIFNTYYTKGYSIPKQSPDTAREISELHSLCSDSTRHKKGDDGYLLDFMINGNLALSESAMLMWVCSQVKVWNYAYTNYELMANALGKDSKYVNTTVKKLERKGLLKIVNKRFDAGLYLIKVHPKIHWKGRYSAYAVAAGLSYEYDDSDSLEIKVDT